MGLRITDMKKSKLPRRHHEALRDHLIDIEAKKWSESRSGNFEELHAEFLKKVKDVRTLLASATLATSMAKTLEAKIRNAEDPTKNTQAAVDPKVLLDLL